MDKYTMNIKSKNLSDKAVSTTIGYINPDAQPSELKALAQGLVALTKNTYQSADRIETINVDTAPDVPAKTARNVTLYINDSPLADDASEYSTQQFESAGIAFKLNSSDIDMFPSCEITATEGLQATLSSTTRAAASPNVITLDIFFRYAYSGRSADITFSIPESLTFLPYSRTLTVNFVQ